MIDESDLGLPLRSLGVEIIAEAEAKGADVIETSPDILSKMSGKDNPQAILGAYRQPDTSLAAIDRSASPLWIVAQALRDPGISGQSSGRETLRRPAA